MGNHDGYPFNLQAFDESKSNPNVVYLSELWDHYLDDDALEMFAR